MVALALLPMAEVVALKVAAVVAAAMVTDAGTATAELEFDKVTVAPPLGAGWFKVTVQVLDEFGPRLVGLQVNEDTNTDATRLTVAVAELLL
jgi:hypothetical protein